MKKFLSLTTALAMALTLSVSAFAAKPAPVNSKQDTVTTESQSIEPRIHWTGSTTLYTEKWVTIVSSNNFFPDSPLITSKSDNPGIVTVRVRNGDGNVVGGTKTMRPGESARLDRIPAFSGDYIIEGIAYDVEGDYEFTVD